LILPTSSVHLSIKRKIYLLIFSLGLFSTALAQQDSLAIPPESYAAIQHYIDSVNNRSLINRIVRWQARRDSIGATKKVRWMMVGGPTYSTETSLGLNLAGLISFRLNKNDSISQNSYAPLSLATSLNGTTVVDGSLFLFAKENKLRFSLKYTYRNAPSHYFGCGYNSIRGTVMSDSTTKYTSQSVRVFPFLSYSFVPNLYVGVMGEFKYVEVKDVAAKILKDEYYNRYASSYRCVGYGVSLQYDTRNDVVTATRGYYLSGIARNYRDYIGSTYSFSSFELEYRHFINVFRPRSTLALTARTRMSVGDVPFTELPSYGSEFNLRGFYGGKYRDRSMAYAMAEYRHMFGSPESLASGNVWAKLGFVVWSGCGTIAPDITGWTQWKWCYGGGLRFQVMPGKNARIDIGRGVGERGVCIYLGMMEVF